MRPHILLAALPLAWPAVAPAQQQADPVAYIRAIYREYSKTEPKPWSDWPYTVRMRKLIVDDAKNTPEGEVGRLDWDPIINAQAWKLSALKVVLISRDGDRATVDASFHNLNANKHMRFTLERADGKWEIDDIAALDKPRWTVSKVLAGAPDAFPDSPAK
jgi:hypothetical protein